MANKTKKKKSDERTTMIIKEHGYEYVLIEGKDRNFTNLASPSI